MANDFDPKMLVEHVDSFGKHLNDFEIKFIADLLDHPPRLYSDPQIKVIERIYEEKC